MPNGVAVEAIRFRPRQAYDDFGRREPTQSRRTRATSTLEIARVLLDYVAGLSWYVQDQSCSSLPALYDKMTENKEGQDIRLVYPLLLFMA